MKGRCGTGDSEAPSGREVATTGQAEAAAGGFIVHLPNETEQVKSSSAGSLKRGVSVLQPVGRG